MNIDPRVIAKLITEDPNHFNEAFAKHLLNEILDPNVTDLGDIEVSVSDSGSRTTYNFSDPRHDSDYIVEFSTKRYNNLYDVNGLDNAMAVDIVLKIDDYNRFAATGKGNFAFVYSRLMTCVVDYFHTRGNDQEFVHFSGYSTDMDSVYNKIIDRLAKKYPDRVYYPYRDGMYISKSTIENIEDDDAKMQILQSIDNQTKMLKSKIASYKSAKRQGRDRRNQPAAPRWDYDSDVSSDDNSGFIDPVTGEPLSMHDIQNPLYHPETGVELETNEEFEAAREWYQHNRPQHNRPQQRRPQQSSDDNSDDYNDPEYSGFTCPITGEPMSVSEIENPLYHPVTGAELETAEEVEAARQWYQQRRPQQS